MDKDRLAVGIDELVKISYKKREALIAFKEAVNTVSELYKIDRSEAFSVLAIMQSIIVGFTIDNSGDDPTLKDIIVEAEDILNRHVEGKREGKNE